MTLRACMRCGSSDLRTPGSHDGFIPGSLAGYSDLQDMWVCDGCGNIGVPLLFDSEKELKAFRDALVSDRKARAKGSRGKAPHR